MSMKAHLGNLVIAVSLLTMVGCGGKHGKNFTEGKIDYTVTYDSATTSRFNPRLLPSTVSIRFKDNNTKTTIEALSGAISFSLIKDAKQQQYTTLIKVIGKKLKHTEQFDTTRFPALYANVPEITIDSNIQQLEMDGLSCHKVSGYFVDPNSRFEIIYTNDIQTLNPNDNTPFEPIKGVLLEFNLLLAPITMQLKANNIEKIRIPKSTFEVSKEYCEVDYKTMKDIISAMQK